MIQVSYTQFMINAVKSALQQFDDDVVQEVKDFIKSKQNPDGGFCGRSDKSDIYYTMFGLTTSICLRLDIDYEQLDKFIASFGNGSELDFVHRVCLLRCLSLRRGENPVTDFELEILHSLEENRTGDGGYTWKSNKRHEGTLYETFLAWGIYTDLHQECPDKAALIDSISKLATTGGAYSNESDMDIGITTATSAAVVVLNQLGQEISETTCDWLRARFDDKYGGFLATADAPIPDLLSTATALMALQYAGYSFAELHEQCNEFIESLWLDAGGFSGFEADVNSDCEYTFYALLALGMLCES